jgi:hypothetical protein
MGFGSHVDLLSFRKLRLEMLRLARECRKLGMSATGLLFWRVFLTSTQRLFVGYILSFILVFSRSHLSYHFTISCCGDLTFSTYIDSLI